MVIIADVFGLSVSYEIMDQARTFPTKPLSKNATQCKRFIGLIPNINS